MSGHSKWATTKHKKAAIDAKRSKLWAKLIKNIEVAARVGGGDPAGNPTLFDAIQKAKKTSVPKENIDRAVKRGSGVGADAVNYIEKYYGGIGVGGIAVLVECLTDNVNRAVAEVRQAFTRNGGKVADDIGSVQRLFARKGLIVVPKSDGVGEDEVMMAALEAGAEEVTDEGDTIEVLCEATDLHAVRTAIVDAGIDYDSADVIFHPDQNLLIPVDVEGARKIMRLIDALEDLDDVQNVYANFDASDEVMAALDDED
jgi:YebC/PmpR family DNA-binding regulatory protein